MSDVQTKPAFLPATAYQPGDRVIGTDEGGSHFGEVSPHQIRARPGTVLVYWAQETYTASSLGHVVEADMLPALRLWPAAAHAARLAEVEAQTPSAPAKKPTATYGYCPRCGEPGVQRERRINGNDRCGNGHEYPSSTAVHPAK
jgi:hypothetical protein